jgi:RHS repeat-associated protein
VTGRITRVLQADQTSYVDFDYGDPNNPYYVWWKEDENRHRTYFYRDASHRIQQISYPGPDTPYETFAYNNFGQVLTHRRRNGFYEHFVYDGEGHLRKAWNPTATAAWPPSDAEPHMEFDYYPNGHPWTDRVSTVKDQRGYSTAYEYDRDSASQPCAGRGLVTRVTHLVDGTYISFAYDQLGNVIAAENELRQRTNLAYDDYSRLITVTPPAPAGAMTLTYERYGTSDPYLHASRAFHLQTDGAGVTVEKRYDENFRPNALIQQGGTASPSTTTLEYWPAGLLKTVHDPRNSGWTTSYTYTARNQLETATDALNHQTFFHYDPAGNTDYVDRPDTKRETRSYDEMNRLRTAVEPVTDASNKTTTFTYLPSGRVHTVQDDNQQVTAFDYDESDLQTRMTYPDTTYQAWGYDDAKNLVSRRTVGGRFQWFYYDGRSRLTNMVWDEPAGVSDWTNFGYDAASQLTSATNQNGTIARTYDEAGRLLAEEQNVYGLGAKTVTYGSDAAGKRAAVGLAATDYQFAYHYDAMGRLDQILNVQNSPDGTTNSLWHQYSYDAASNVTQRYCPMNGVAQIYTRDELGRIDTLTIKNATEPQYGAPKPPPIGAAGSSPVVPVPPLPRPLSLLAGLTNLTSTVGQTVPTIGTIITSEHYLYDAMSRVTNVQRGGQDDGFGYDYADQVTTASYTGWNGGGTRNVNYSQDNLGNRNQVNDNGNVQGYSPMANYRNQYASAPAGPVSNGTEHEIAGYEGLNYTYYGDRRLASVSGNGNSYGLAYDALGRCVKRTLKGNVVYYTYDGPHPIYEWKADGSKAGWNLYGQGIDEILLRADYQVVSAGQGYFFQQNRLGSVAHLTGFAGEVIEKYRYDAFGQPTTTYSGGSFNNRFKFTGREYQQQLGIYEYRNRAYHPGLGRFLSEDPVGFAAGDTNLFRYCGGDPVNWTDSFGFGRHKQEYNNEGIDPGSTTVNYGGSPAYEGGTEEDPSNYGVANSGSSDPVSVNFGPAGGPGGVPGGTGPSGPGQIALGPSGNISSSGHGPGDGNGPGGGGGTSATPGSSHSGSAPASFVMPTTPDGRFYFDKDWLNGQLRRYGKAHRSDLRQLDRMADFMTYGVAYPAAFAVGGMAIAEALPIGFESCYGPQYYIRYFANGIRSQAFRTSAQYVMEDAEFGVIEPVPPPPPTVAAGPVIPGP